MRFTSQVATEKQRTGTKDRDEDFDCHNVSFLVKHFTLAHKLQFHQNCCSSKSSREPFHKISLSSIFKRQSWASMVLRCLLQIDSSISFVLFSLSHFPLTAFCARSKPDSLLSLHHHQLQNTAQSMCFNFSASVSTVLSGSIVF